MLIMIEVSLLSAHSPSIACVKMHHMYMFYDSDKQKRSVQIYIGAIFVITLIIVIFLLCSCLF